MELLLYLQQIRNPFLNILFKFFTFMGEDYFIVAILCLFIWCGNKEWGHRIGFTFCTGMMINQMLKISFCVPRPWIINDKIIPLEGTLKNATGYSFPSGHTQSSVMIFGMLTNFFNNKWIFLIAFAVAFSRLYFGVHTVLDVTISIALGILSIILMEKIYDKYKQKILLITLIAILLCGGAVLYTALKQYPEGFVPELVADVYKVSGAMSGFFVGWFAEGRYVNYRTDANMRVQALKAIIGLAALGALKLLFSHLPETAFFHFTENFVLIIWCVLIYPLTFKFWGKPCTTT